MKKIRVSSGIYWVEIPEANLYIMCGCPADSIKHLINKGLVMSEGVDSGFFHETGPNAILLSDIPIQKEVFSNMSEFPVLQMLYRQGMFIPNHPNNTGIKPMLIGNKKEIEAQSNYIYRGNYGLISLNEIMSAGIDRTEAEEMMRIKLKFAFGKMRDTNEFIETKIVEDDPVEIRNGVYIKRLALNHFEISYQDEKVEVDLNLASEEEYESPYTLRYHKITREYFSVVHTGEGNGWDVNRPCMGSIITFQGKIYLVDAGPNITHILESLGISINEIEGIFQTHSHDDHFGGLVALMRTDHRIKYYSTRLVRTSVVKKLAALTSINESEFDKYYEFHDLDVNLWNNIDGLEVKLIYSPHPVETNIVFFRTLWVDGYKTYAHLADITSFNVLKNMVTDSDEENGISTEYYERIKDIYLTPVLLKKIDVGGGMIHGSAEDFLEDRSQKILLSHNEKSLTSKQKEIGESTFFGIVDNLIPSQRDYTKSFAHNYLKEYFKSVPSYDLNMLLNCPVVSFNPSSILMKRGEKNENIFIVLSGIIEYINHDLGLSNKLTVGTIVGEVSAMKDLEANWTYRAVSYVKVIKVPRDFYMEFLKRNNIFYSIKDIAYIRDFLQNTSLFGERVSSLQHNQIAHSIERKVFKAHTFIPVTEDSCAFLLFDGEITIKSGEKVIEHLKSGDFFGEDQIILKSSRIFKYMVRKDAIVFVVPSALIEEIPIIQCKLLETYQRRVGLSEMSHFLE